MFKFKSAKREGVHLILGVIGGTGSGKTWSALELATGLAGGETFAVIDTEAGRGKHYADSFHFDHGDLPPPHSPDAYIEAIQAADTAGYPAIVVDSMTHVWAGDGGVLDWHEQELQRMAGDDWKKREACKMAGWIKPKQAHKRMVQKLLQLRSHLILCFRAEPKTKMERNPKTGKTVITDIGWQPVCEKNLPFELTASFLLSHEAPGFPNNPLKLPAALHGFFPPDKPIGRDAGVGVAKWASGNSETSAEIDGGELLAKIAIAKTQDELEALVPLLKTHKGSDKPELRKAFMAKKKELQ